MISIFSEKECDEIYERGFLTSDENFKVYLQVLKILL
uniref:Uncharacterized protein n=1 Tax=viral metagenome TaxID=1070528 RepID=A0A6C0AGD1_9ZZZZ